MLTLRSMKVYSVVLIALLLLMSTTMAASAASASSANSLSVSTITSDLRVANVVPTWGQQIPKIVYDGQWYYATSLDGELTSYPWEGKIFKSKDGENWTLAASFINQTTYQPPGFVVDHYGNLHMQVGCYGNSPCFPGFTATGTDNVSYHHVVFTKKLPDGSFDFSTFEDYSLLDLPLYYFGTAIDHTGRYIYTAYSDASWNLRISVFDVNTKQYIVSKVLATPPENRAWLYPKVEPGNQPGEIYILTGQYVLGAPNSAVYDKVNLLYSDDWGRSWSEPQEITSVQNPDGYDRWVDASDIDVDANGDLHIVYFKKSPEDETNTLFYKDGATGESIGLGQVDNHAQIRVAPSGERFIFATSNNALVVLRSSDGVTWNQESYPVDETRNVFWPTLVDRDSGSHTTINEVQMMVSGQGEEGPQYSHLLLLKYQYHPDPS